MIDISIGNKNWDYPRSKKNVMETLRELITSFFSYFLSHIIIFVDVTSR